MNINDIKRTRDKLEAATIIPLSEDVTASFDITEQILYLKDVANTDEAALNLPEMQELHDFLGRLLKGDE